MRHLLSSADLDREAAVLVLDTAEQMAASYTALYREIAGKRAAG